MTAALVLARMLHLGSALLLVSLLLFRDFWMLKREEPDCGESVFLARLSSWLVGCLAIQLVSGALWFWIVSANMSGCTLLEVLDANVLKTMLLQTQFGQLWLERIVAGIALGILLLGLPSRRQVPTKPATLRPLLTLLASGFLLLSLAWAGHGASGLHHRAWHLSADLIHLGVGAVWPMGLVPLALFLSWAQHVDQLSSARKVAVLQRFSQASLVAVILLFVSGFVNAWFLIPSWRALFTTPYGRLLLGKVALFLAMVALGARNRISLLPQLAGPVPPLSAFTSLRRAVVLESVLAFIVLLIVGIMGVAPPPQPPSANPETNLTPVSHGLSSIGSEP